MLQLACNLTAAGSPGTRLLASHLFTHLSPRLGTPAQLAGSPPPSWRGRPHCLRLPCLLLAPLPPHAARLVHASHLRAVSVPPTTRTMPRRRGPAQWRDPGQQGCGAQGGAQALGPAGVGRQARAVAAPAGPGTTADTPTLLVLFCCEMGCSRCSAALGGCELHTPTPAARVALLRARPPAPAAPRCPARTTRCAASCSHAWPQVQDSEVDEEGEPPRHCRVSGATREELTGHLHTRISQGRCKASARVDRGAVWAPSAAEGGRRALHAWPRRDRHPARPPAEAHPAPHPPLPCMRERRRRCST